MMCDVLIWSGDYFPAYPVFFISLSTQLKYLDG